MKLYEWFPRDEEERDEWVAEYRRHAEEWKYWPGPNVYVHKTSRRALPAEHLE